MAEDKITNILRTLAGGVKDSIKEYNNEEATKEEKDNQIEGHITIASLRIEGILKSIKEELNDKNDRSKATSRLRY